MLLWGVSFSGLYVNVVLKVALLLGDSKSTIKIKNGGEKESSDFGFVFCGGGDGFWDPDLVGGKEGEVDLNVWHRRCCQLLLAMNTNAL